MFYMHKLHKCIQAYYTQKSINENVNTTGDKLSGEVHTV